MKQQFNILIVDDEPINIQLLKEIFTIAGYIILTANSGAQSLQILQQQLPDLILLDILMPEMDGLEVLRKIKENPDTHDLPVIMVTASTNSVHKEESVRLGALAFISKPIYQKDILDIVNNILKVP